MDQKMKGPIMGNLYGIKRAINPKSGDSRTQGHPRPKSPAKDRRQGRK
jgi:hypothetical protein